jgi:SulP family sulfate permease
MLSKLQLSVQDITSSLSVSFLTIAAGAALGEWAGIGASAGILGMVGAAVFGSFFGGIPVKVSGLSATTGALYISILETTSLAQGDIVWSMLFASILLFVVGFLRPSRIMKYIPNTVIAGFVNGVALLLMYKQLQKIFVSDLSLGIESYLAISAAFILLLWRHVVALPQLGKIGNFVSGSLLVMVLGGVLQFIYAFEVSTLSVNISSLTNIVTIPVWPIPPAIFIDILIQGFFIAFIVLISTLITARALDASAPLDAETKNQSVANAVSALLGAFPTSIGFIRTIILKRNNATSPLSGVLVGVWTFIIVFFFSTALSYIPTAVFIGILLIAGYRALDVSIFKDIKHSPSYYSALVVFLLTTYFTFVGQLAIAVITGSVLWQLCKYIPRLHLKDAVHHRRGVDIT